MGGGKKIFVSTLPQLLIHADGLYKCHVYKTGIWN